ncbi:nucleotide synthetase [Caulobacter segnis]|uniref:nucleotide synthetase n=1 Tax=Caulobacter segnis TaxID=88688 RepID=UPI001CBC00C0|nr:nucleotide synthetase [Caulobacter segnis]UAL08695.1 hypothetical protein K8940_12815 [Caulobacter segnis]
MSERIPTTRPADFLPEKIVHVVLTVDRGKLPKKEEDPWTLDFTIKEPSEQLPTIPPGDEKKVMEYAVQRANPGFRDINLVPVPSPFDIKVDRPCWVVVELDAKIANWQFAKGERGATTKAESDRNCYLRHVYDDGAQPAGERAPRDRCRVLYFGVVARDAGGTSLAGDLFNFHTEFRMEENGVEKRLNVIFDPDVKNEGTKFPP